MAITSIGAFPNRDDPSFKAYLDQYFSTILPNFSQELDEVATAFNNGSLSATSTSSHTINLTAGKVFTVAAGLSFLKGMWVVAVSTATTDTNNYMVCMVQNYTGTSLTLDPKSIGGSGTIASWRIVIVPPAASAVQQHEVVLSGGAGYGTTNTYIRNFSTISKNVGTSITPALSASLGASITINSTGIYAVTYQEPSGLNSIMSVSINAVTLTAAPSSSVMLASAFASSWMVANFVGEIASGSVLRAHPSALTAGTTGAYFRVVRLAIGG